MFEAYKVGVTLALQNQVSGVLGFIARDFIKVNAQAKALQASLKEIKLLGMGGAIIGGMGFLGLGLIGKAVKPATEYAHQLERMKNAGMSQLEIAQATAAAWKATGTVMTTTASGNLAAISELRMVFRNTQDAIEHMDTVQKLQAVLQNLKGGKSGHDEAYTVAKALEMKGSVRNVSQFEGSADLMTKAIITSGGKVGASDFLSTFKYGRTATIGWDDQFTYSVLPTLIQEMKTSGGSGGSGGPGNALMSAYAAVVGGTIAQKSLKVWQGLGMLDPSKIVWDKVGSAKGVAPGGVKGSVLFEHNPYQWTKEYLVPALVKAGYNTEDKQRQALQYLFPNRTAGFIMSQMALQGWKIEGDIPLIRQAKGLSAYDESIRNDPKMAFEALSAQWENLKTSIGVTVIPVILPALRGLTSAFNTLGQFFQRHPTFTSAFTMTFTALSGLAALGGTLMIAGAGLKLIGVGLVPLRLALAGMGVLPLAGMATGIGNLVLALGPLAAIAAAWATVYYHKEIADTVDKTSWGQWIGDKLLAAKNFSFGESLSGHTGGSRGYAPPASGKTIQVDSTINMDSRAVAKAVTRHQEQSTSGPSTSGARFDPRLSFMPTGVSGSY